MTPKPYPRPKPTPRRLAQPELDQRCIACKAGSHRNCRGGNCRCNDNWHEES